ncbi:MAG: hypothetical protein ABW123_11100, partial [Cystobacter sp.]
SNGSDSPLLKAQRERARGVLEWVLLACAALAVCNLLLVRALFSSKDDELFFLLCFGVLAQLIAGVIAMVYSAKARSSGLAAFSAAFVMAAPFTAMVGLAAVMGGSWGRPLRVRGRQLHPELRRGSDWTQGEHPDPRGLDEPTRAALEALWLHDAQKEHASVPAFSRLSWLLAAVGAPAELLEGAHRAAMEEIAHTRLCFALAAGYAGRSYTVEPMPELLLGGLELQGRALEVLASESVTDGCQLEDFNADVAAACAAVCEEPVTRRVLEQIAREERSHAEFSWAMLEWLLEREPTGVRAAIEAALLKLDRYPRPTAVSSDKRALVSRADPAALRRHGRLPDAQWAAAWEARLGHTRARVAKMLGAEGSRHRLAG